MTVRAGVGKRLHTLLSEPQGRTCGKLTNDQASSQCLDPRMKQKTEDPLTTSARISKSHSIVKKMPRQTFVWFHDP